MPLSQDEQDKYKTLYLQTAREYIKEMKENFGQLLTGNETVDVLDIIHRDAHSLKGQSTMMEYTSIAAVSGLIEDVFQMAKEQSKKLSNDLLRSFAEAVDEMEVSMEEIDKNNKEKDLSDLTENLRALIKKQS